MMQEEQRAMNQPILESRSLKVERGGAVLLNLPLLKITRGEILALIGPNGAGKSTLLQTLSCLMRPFKGELYFHGEKIDSHPSMLKYRRRLAMVFQEPLLFDTTVFHNVASGLKIRGIKKNEIRDRVMEQLKQFGIAHLIDRSAKTLSGGEAQRTSLARAFALQPEILFLDEPFSSLDPPTRASLLEDMERILYETKTTTIFATHDRLEAMQLSDRIAVMHGGTILQIGSPEQIMNQPIDEFVASFVGVETILSGTVLKKESGTFVVSVSGTEVEAVGDFSIGEAVILCIRPEHVTLSLQFNREATSARNVFKGKIVKVSTLGPYQKISLDCKFPLVAYVTNRSLEELNLTEGKEVKASFKATAIHAVRKKITVSNRGDGSRLTD